MGQDKLKFCACLYSLRECDAVEDRSCVLPDLKGLNSADIGDHWVMVGVVNDF